MTQLTDERFDEALLDFLEWQSADRAMAPGAGEVARRIAGRRGAVSRTSVRLGLAVAATLMALLVIGFALVVGSRPVPPVAVAIVNGDISLPDGLAAFDWRTGTSVEAPRCGNCASGRDAAWSADGSSLAFVGATGGLWVWRDGETLAQMIGGCPDANCQISGPSWSPDGRSIVYIGGGRLYVTDVASRAIRAVPRSPASLPVYWARWTDDGHITFVATKAGSHAYAVWTVRIDGSGAEVIAELPLNLGVAISPAGDRIAYVDDPPTGAKPAGNTLQLWVSDVSGTSRHLVYERPGCCLGMQIGGPAWSPDGTSVAFVGPTTVGKVDDVSLMRFDAVTGERTILAHASPSSGSPAWRPQRAPAAATTPAPIPSRDPGETRSPETPTSNGDIVLAGDLAAIDAPTGALMGNLACQPCLGAHQPSWSWDGTTLAFVDAGSLKTWRDGDAAPRTLIACPGDRCPVELPSWAPGGGSILFGSGGRLFEIETTSLAIHAVPLPAGQAMARPAGWAVGDRIAFVTTASDWSVRSTDTLWIADSGGADAHVVATDPYLFWASIAPSGDRIAVVTSPGNPTGVEPFNAEVQVRVYPTDGGGPRLLLRQPGCCRGGGLVDGVAWSPDTTTLALIVPYQNFEGGFARALTLIDVASGAANVLSPRMTGTRAIDEATFGDGGAPAWRPIVAAP